LLLDESSPEWKLEYTFDEAYGYKAYNAENLVSLSNAIEDDPKVREKFIGFVCQESHDNPPANMDNWKFFSCSHLHLDPESYMSCYK
jgi:predicted oxidoreductase